MNKYQVKELERNQVDGSIENVKSIQSHPKGLYVLFATEMWERFSYYGTLAVLILFMTKALMYDKKFASNLYGSYTGLIYLTPLIGGYIADRFWGNGRSIITGGLLMALGQLLLFFCGTVYQTLPHLALILFFAGLGFLITGNGFFKPNISTMVGQLYPKGDPRIDVAYTIFYIGINVGGFLGPLICGFLGDTGNPSDFRWGFFVAGIGMLLSVLIFSRLKNRFVLSPDGDILGTAPIKRNEGMPIPTYVGLTTLVLSVIAVLYIDVVKLEILSYLLIIALFCIVFMVFSDQSLTKRDKQNVSAIFIIAFFVIFFWSAFEQTSASLAFFAEEHTRRTIGPYTIPASFFQSLNFFFIITFAPLFAILWSKLRNCSLEPSSPTKMACGLMLLVMGYLVMAYGVRDMQPNVKISMMWLTSMYALHSYGELCLSPIGLALVNKLAPARFASLLMAVWFLAMATGNKLAGVLSGFYPEHGKPVSYLMGFEITGLYEFFMIFVVIAGMASIVLFAIGTFLQKMMK